MPFFPFGMLSYFSRCAKFALPPDKTLYLWTVTNPVKRLPGIPAGRWLIFQETGYEYSSFEDLEV